MILAALSLAQAAPDPRAEANAADLRCIGAITLASSKLTEEEREGALAGTYYFVGRIEGRSPDFDFESALKALGEQPGAERVLTGELSRCGAMLRAKSEELSGTAAEKARRRR